MADNKLTKSVGEHWVCAVMAGHGWAVALTRDGLERTDILGVHPASNAAVEVQVKAASYSPKPTWILGEKAQQAARTSREWFVLVALASDPASAHRAFVVPRDHVAAAAHIGHMHWLTEPGIPAGKRATPLHLARQNPGAFAGYEGRWDLLLSPADEAPILLPAEYRRYAQEERVGLPDGHPWRAALPDWN